MNTTLKHRSMIVLYYVCALLFFFPVAGHTEGDASAALQGQQIAQGQMQHTDQMAKWVESIKHLNDQLTEAKKYVSLMNDVKTVMGDPTQVASLLNSDLIGAPKMGEMSKTFSELGKTAGNASSLGSDIKGLYSPVNFAGSNPLSSIDMSGHDPLAKFQAVENAFSNLSNELTRSESEANTIRQEIDKINKRTASTQSEQAQKQADLQAATAKLADAKKRSDEAFQKLQAMKTLNDSMAAKEDEVYIKQLYENDKKVNTYFRSSMQRKTNEK